MRAILLALFAVLSTLLGGSAGADPVRPVLVELFSSEGCSSCPAADAVLAELDRDQPLRGAEVIALEMHVDYWNRLGWADPFSSAAYSARQSDYAVAMGQSGVYTPQAVVDGATALVGSRSASLRQAISREATVASAKVELALADGKLRVKVGALPPGADSQAQVWLAVAERGLTTDVPRGENAGRHLVHGPVVRNLERLGGLRGGAYYAEVPAALPQGVQPQNAQFVVFVQERKSLHVLGAAMIAAR
jgi:hypothetical protein